MSEDERLGDSKSSEAEISARNTWQNMRMANAAGWTKDEWNFFLDTGRYPKEQEERSECRRDPIY